MKTKTKNNSKCCNQFISRVCIREELFDKRIHFSTKYHFSGLKLFLLNRIMFVLLLYACIVI